MLPRLLHSGSQSNSQCFLASHLYLPVRTAFLCLNLHQFRLQIDTHQHRLRQGQLRMRDTLLHRRQFLVRMLGTHLHLHKALNNPLMLDILLNRITI